MLAPREAMRHRGKNAIDFTILTTIIDLQTQIRVQRVATKTDKGHTNPPFRLIFRLIAKRY